LHAPESVPVQSALEAFAAMTSHQMRWRTVELDAKPARVLGLHSDAHVPVLALTGLDTDPLIALGFRQLHR
jgi:hypothetical protein